jgi:hypothetical protein
MRIRHYFSQLSLSSAASYDLHPDDPKCANSLDPKDDLELGGPQVCNASSGNNRLEAHLKVIS